MITQTTIARRGNPIKYAPATRVRDPKVGRTAHRLYDEGVSSSPGGAHQLMLRRRRAFLEIVSAFVREDDAAGLDAFLGPIDELRYGGFHVKLCPGAMVSIETRDSADGPARMAWFESMTVEKARHALRESQRSIVACCEFIRVLFTNHPELRS